VRADAQMDSGAHVRHFRVTSHEQHVKACVDHYVLSGGSDNT
jgi:hypothetical protein